MPRKRQRRDCSSFPSWAAGRIVRFFLKKASGNNSIGQILLEYDLKLESEGGLRTWYARVPTEANISDWRLETNSMTC